MDKRKIINSSEAFSCDEKVVTSTSVNDSHLLKHPKTHEKLQGKHDQNISQSSDSFRTTMWAGSACCPSEKSSEGSFHSAESTIAIKKLPLSDGNVSVTSTAVASLKNISEPFESEFSSIPSTSIDNVLNENIKENSVKSIQTSLNPSQKSDVDLGKAQNLFGSKNSHDCHTSNMSDISFEADNLHFLSGNHSSTQYIEVPTVLKNLISLCGDENDETTKEVTQRLARSFCQDPREFTKRLMTIIEESNTNYDLDQSACSVNKMVSAYLKMCKYVEDESMPPMCDNVSLARDETSQAVSIFPEQNNTNERLSSQETSTPINSKIIEKKFVSKISPLIYNKNTSKILNSPLYISTLTRVLGSPEKQTTPKSVNSTPRSTRIHDESSFTFWEKKLGARPFGRTNYIVSDISDDEKEQIAKVEKQLRLLQAEDSPYMSPKRTQKNIYNINCDGENKDKSPSIITTPTNLKLDHIPSIENDITESIMYELNEKRKRCIETERTIRQIDAESSAYSNSPQTSENESEKMVQYLNALRNRTEYKNFLEHHEINPINQGCDDSGIENISLSNSPRKSGTKIIKTAEKLSHGLTVDRENHHNVTMRKKSKNDSTNKKSPTIRASRISPSRQDVKLKKSSGCVKSPALMSRNIVSSKLADRPISPIDGPFTKTKYKSEAVLQTPKSSLSSKPRLDIQRTKSPSLKVYPPIKLQSQLLCKTPEPSSAKKSSLKNDRKPSIALSTSKPINYQIANSQFLRSKRGLTLEYLDSAMRERSSRTNNGKLLTENKSQSENKFCLPTIQITKATPTHTYQKSQQSSVLKQKNVISPTARKGGHNVEGKFFNTPGKTPVRKIRPKPMTFFSIVDGERKPVLETQVLTQYYSPGVVKSPVAEYIHGTDTTLVQNIRGKKNEYLLTPKSKNKETTDQLKFKLSAEKNEGQKSKQNSVLNCKVDLFSDVNDENINKNNYNHPKVCYQSPATVHEIKVDLDGPRGARAKRLMEAKDSRVVIQHAGRAIPQVHSIEPLDVSIHLAKSAEKKKFLFRYHNNKH